MSIITGQGRRAGLLAAAVVALGLFLAAPQLATAAPAPPAIPGGIAVPEGNVFTGQGHAEGFQIYTCQPKGDGFAWSLQQPQAVLFEGGHKAFALHYGGPSWTAMDDGSTVVGARMKDVPSPSGSIPWLLLGAASTSGPEGGTFTSTTFIHRINTTGGVAPATGCDADHLGATARIFYTADYLFYAAA